MYIVLVCLGSPASPSPRKNNNSDTDYLMLARKGGGHSGTCLITKFCFTLF